MNDVAELTKLLTPKMMQRIRILGQTQEPMVEQFYELLADQRVETDEDALRLLYGRKQTFSGYEKLKTKLKERLVDAFFLIDENEAINNNPDLAFEAASELWTATNLLFLKNAITNGLEYGTKALEMAMQYEHANLVLQISKTLRKIYTTFMADEQQFNYYHQLYTDYSDLASAEGKAESCAQQMSLVVARAAPNNEDIVATGEQLLVEIWPFLQQYNHFSIHRNIRYIQLTTLISGGQYEAAITAAQDAIDYFRTKDFDINSTIISFLHYQIACHIQCQNYAEGMRKVKESLAIIDEKEETTYFKVQESAFLLAMHCQEYLDAVAICSSVLAHPKLNTQSDNLKATWSLYQAYLQYLVAVEVLPPSSEEDALAELRNSRFSLILPDINEVPRSKAIPQLIVQIAYSMATKRYDLAVERIHLIKQYASRYIRRNEQYRTNCFINMLAQIPAAGFHRAATTRNTQKLLTKLQEVSLELINQPHEIEIIPYERLWDSMLELLAMKRITIRKKLL